MIRFKESPADQSTATPAGPVVFRSLSDWRRDTSGKPLAISDGKKVRATEGRVARAERLLLAGEEPEDIAVATGLSEHVVQLLAVELQAAEPAEGAKETKRARGRQEWLLLLRDGHLCDVPLILKAAAENLHRGRMFRESLAASWMAAKLQLRFALLLATGKQYQTDEEPPEILKKLRVHKILDRPRYVEAKGVIGNWRPAKNERHIVDRSRRAIDSVDYLRQLFADIGTDVEKPARDVQEAQRVYHGYHSAGKVA